MSDVLNSSVDRRGGIVRTALAFAVVVAFWAGLARAMWTELAPPLFAAWQALRGASARRVEGRYVVVRDASSADDEVLQAAVAQLDAGVAAISRFLGREPEGRIQALVVDGVGPAVSDGVRLTLYHDRGKIDLSTAPLFLVLLSEGPISFSGTDLFVQASYALYVTHAVDRALPLIGQSPDAWVTLMARREALLPLDEATHVAAPKALEETYDLVRATLEGASFMWWLAQTQGEDAVTDLSRGASISQVTGMDLGEAERAWLAWVAALGLEPRPCAEALAEDSVLRVLCEGMAAP